MNKMMDEMLCKLLWIQLRKSGWLDDVSFSSVEWKKAICVPEMYREWLEESLNLLVRQNYLTLRGDVYMVNLKLTEEADAVWGQWDDYQQEALRNPDRKAQMMLLDATLRSLPDILTGKIPATDVLFPGSSMERVEGIYKNNQLADYYNEVLANTVAAYLEERLSQDSSATVSILEIGAGTGGTSAVVLQKLEPFQDHIAEYCYSDLSRAFLMHAEKEFGPKHPFLAYRIFNVEEPIAEQGIRAGEYDLVIASNVLHATKSIRHTLRNVKALLKRNGWLLLNEMSRNTIFAHLTFGLLEGWWLYEDKGLRIEGSPALYPETWKTVLEWEGYHSIFFPAEEVHDMGQQIIAAESDGIVVHEMQYKHPATAEQPLAAASRPETPQRVETAAGSTDETEMLESFVKSVIAEKLAESLKLNGQTIDPYESFADYGVDSITGVHFVQIVNEALETDLKTTILFDYTSINQLAKYLISHYKEILLNHASWSEKETGLSAQPEKRSAENVPYPFKGQSNDLPQEKSTGPLSQEGAKQISGGPDHPASEQNEASMDKEPIAIIGMSGRFAKSESVNELWTHLANGSDLIQEVTRWNLAEYLPFHTESFCNRGSFVEGIDEFDPLFFNISGTEANYMDPQQRIFLEESWKALEDAGYAGEAADGLLCGVYAGYNRGDYIGLLGDHPPAQAMWGNSGAVLPARIAYYLNLHGPAVTVDTACSSSLVAIHLACQSLWMQETEMALAGGVFIQSTPDFYLGAIRAGMLSPNGRCHAFDNRADGFVPGEGAGVVVLKRLNAAIADGDHIYGIIRGSGINQDGTTNGITAPSGNSQERLERYVYERFGIDPSMIQMVEAHGTGTILGDPIEYEALTRAFRAYTDKKNYCAIGSVKTNIGHTSAAAGIAGLLKILLSLKHRKIPPSLHFETGNANISFDDSPFYVNTVLREWAPGNDFKRLASISAFGFGGTNAHMVIEEAPPLQSTRKAKPGYLIVLSARSPEQLRKQAERLLVYCSAEPLADLGNISYTLMTGRKHFQHRLACIVHNQQELKSYLKTWLEQGESSHFIAAANPEAGRGSLKEYGNQCIRDCKKADGREFIKLLEAIGALYIQGHALEYSKLFAGDHYNRIPLPTYPFARERYWVPTPVDRLGDSNKAGNVLKGVIHPLLHRDSSCQPERGFSSSFTGEEAFLADHVLQGNRVLPGAAYLEMARAAVEAADTEEGRQDTETGIRLKRVEWVNPLIVAEGLRDVHVGLHPFENGDMGFEIFSDPGLGKDRIIHCRGSAERTNLGPNQALDIPLLLAECSLRTVESQPCYEAFKTIGLDYGPSHKGIRQLHIGKGMVLARLGLPELADDSNHRFGIHPGMVDSALQAVAGLLAGQEDAATTSSPSLLRPILPFVMEQLDIISVCTPEMWALVRYSDGSIAGDGVHKLDIDLADDSGNVCLRFRGFTLKAMEGMPDSSSGSSAGIDMLMLEPVWKEAAVDNIGWKPVQSLVVLSGPFDDPHHNLAALTGQTRVIFMEFGETSLEQRLNLLAIRLLEELQTILREKTPHKTLIQLVINNRKEGRLYAGLSGMLKTACLENPKIYAQVIEIDPDTGTERLAEIIKDNESSPWIQHIRYIGGRRLIPEWNEVDILSPTDGVPWKNGGTYLITGGAGGLGFLFAREIAERVQNANLVLIGRSELNPDKLASIKALQYAGNRVVYKQADVGQMEETARLIRDIQTEYGELSGILHCAGVIRDNYILNKTEEELIEVLGPKVSGTINLDRASKDLPLDFFVCFSAAAGVIGNAGQADYAAANAFMDAYAAYRNELTAENKRYGRTFSINWPLWKEGGMHPDSETKLMLEQNIGMKAMDSSQGMHAFYGCLASGKERVMVIAGHKKKLRSFLLQTAAGHPRREPVISLPDNAVLKERAEGYFKKMLASVVGLPVERIEVNQPFENYGMDSIMIMKITTDLETIFGTLSKTLFFEYRNIGEVVDYFLKEHRTQTANLLGFEEDSVLDRAETAACPGDEPADSEKGRDLWETYSDIREVPGTTERDIAIIGLSGRYPEAGNLQKFWENLVNGRDCIREIPKDRWNHGLYFDKDRNKAGKAYTKWGGFLDGIDEFDPLFFQISPREAERMDPQERLFLQCVYEAIEDSGYTKNSLGTGSDGKRDVGVYVGVMFQEYPFIGVEETMQGRTVALAGTSSSIANRVSYFCDFHGPSMAVDTMCSASLTALHLACQSLIRQECRVAVAGGVNVSVHPNKYLFLSEGKFASSKGRCESFGQGGDGYVPGEGVGAVLLKPLSQAIKDGDHIYGVIKATSINHGGKTNGYSVPSPNAQAEVITRAYKEAGIDPRTVSYVEAHGTGTSLGDPIEIAGLVKTFRSHTADNQFCAIGSVKSNIGHCESAAGIAGLTKVLLQMKHGQLVPSLHSQTLNPNIDFSATPFVVQQELSEWKRPKLLRNGILAEYPRIAGISSFGAGGSNAHLVIEEFIPAPQEAKPPRIEERNPALIVLSAKDEDRLREAVELLLTEIKRRPITNEMLADVAYTLQIGREDMEARLALTAASIDELETKLHAYEDGKKDIEGLFLGQVRDHHDTLEAFRADEDLAKTLEVWMAKRKYVKLLNLWVKGMPIDWSLLNRGIKYRRVSLPTYPFARERYWVTDNAVKQERPTSDGVPILHPLLHQNTSDLFQQRFTSVFTGREFFLADHRIFGRPIFPGVAYLEMANAAVGWAAGTLKGEMKRTVLKDVVWLQTFAVDEAPARLHIELVPEADDEIAYEIYSIDGKIEDSRRIHSQGKASFIAVEEEAQVDLVELQKLMEREVSPATCYEVFQAMGIEYGPGHTAMQHIYEGSGQLLAKLALPVSVAANSGQFDMHPSLLDSALQASIGLFLDEGAPLDTGRLKPIVPFSLEALEILQTCSPVMWAWIRLNPTSNTEAEVKLDLDLCDESGRVCVRMQGLTSRVLEGGAGGSGTETLLLEPVWKEAAFRPNVQAPEFARRLAVICEPGADLAGGSLGEVLGGRCIVLNDAGQAIDRRFTAYAMRVLEEIRSMLNDQSAAAVFLQVVVPADGEGQLLSGLSGLL
ncbi:polyketide synthase PksN, partial [Paenibacillus forsythiae]